MNLDYILNLVDSVSPQYRRQAVMLVYERGVIDGINQANTRIEARLAKSNDLLREVAQIKVAS